MDNQDGAVSASDIEAVQKQLSQIANDPDTVFLHCHCLDVEALVNNTKPRPREETCPKCPVYIKFALKYHNRIPCYEIEGCLPQIQTLVIPNKP